MTPRDLDPRPGDALLLLDVQNDFLPGGSLAAPGGEEVVPLLSRAIERFVGAGLPIFATRDWHPASHSSFREQGGPWPSHCVQNTWGARFAPGLVLPEWVAVISKATSVERDAYSGFDSTDLAERLHMAQVVRVIVGGLTTEYCVLETVRDALARGYLVVLLIDAIRSIEVRPGDGERAVREMLSLGATPMRIGPARDGDRVAIP